MFRNRNGKPRRLTKDVVRRVVACWRPYAGLLEPGSNRDKNVGLIDENPAELLRQEAGRNIFELPLLRQVAEVQRTRTFTVRPFGSQAHAHAYALGGILYCAHCECRALLEKDATLRSRIGGMDKNHKGYYRHAEAVRCSCQRRSIWTGAIEDDFQRLMELLSVSAEQISELVALAERTGNQPQDAALWLEKQEALLKCRRKLDANRFLYEDGELSREEYANRKLAFEQEIIRWESILPETEQAQLSPSAAIDAIQHLAETWNGATAEEKQVLVRGLFEAIYYDLDQQLIIDFRLKPWAEPYLLARQALYVAQDAIAHSNSNGASPETAASSHFKGWHYLWLQGASSTPAAPHLPMPSTDFCDFSMLDNRHLIPRCPAKLPNRKVETLKFAANIGKACHIQNLRQNIKLRRSALLRLFMDDANDLYVASKLRPCTHLIGINLDGFLARTAIALAHFMKGYGVGR